MTLCISPAALQFSMMPHAPMSQNYEMTRVSSVKKGKIFHVLAFTAEENVQRQKHTQVPLSQKRVQVSGVQNRAVLSAVIGAWLPLPDQQMFGFEVKHVSVRLSLPALAVHAFLGVLHHLLCFLYHLRNIHKHKDINYPVLRCWQCPESISKKNQQQHNVITTK